ncbi:hypothetical protein ED236_09415 [Pseudomethylobacillus aquaticus]|uniref:Uncharacterized protein n=1 Tax=Pseudomethylobacillus aquaticus TaxID=2676064 RepID=A0A3N0UXY5_9PROT|nr:hypothetical protein [Pseudomethylobacillus aquaticus]ROH85407.1 hypothetical protein ED236_09415 [Pseudomethylobacillus aquaticus]
MNKNHKLLGTVSFSMLALWCLFALITAQAFADNVEMSADTASQQAAQLVAVNEEASSTSFDAGQVDTPEVSAQTPAQTAAVSEEHLPSDIVTSGTLPSETGNDQDANHQDVSADIVALIDSTELPVISFMQDDAPVLAGPLTGPNGLLGLGSVYGANIQEIMGIDGARNSLIPDATLIDLLTSSMPPTMPFTTSRADSISSVLQPVQTPAAAQPGMVAVTTAPVPVSTLPAPMPTPDSTVPVAPAAPAAPSPVDTPPDTMVSP